MKTTSTFEMTTTGTFEINQVLLAFFRENLNTGPVWAIISMHKNKVIIF